MESVTSTAKGAAVGAAVGIAAYTLGVWTANQFCPATTSAATVSVMTSTPTFAPVRIAASAMSLLALAALVSSCCGFTASGISRGSMGASMMSITAVVGGGGIGCSSIVAILQSIGMAGLPAPASMLLLLTSNVVGWAPSQKVVTTTIAAFKPIKWTTSFLIASATTGAALGADFALLRIHFFKLTNATSTLSSEKSCWIVVERQDSGNPQLYTFDDEVAARIAFEDPTCCAKAKAWLTRRTS